jgi:MFS family permease
MGEQEILQFSTSYFFFETMGGFFICYLCDTLGRYPMLIAVNLLGGLFSCAIVFSYSFMYFLIVKSCNGFFRSGIIAVCSVYMAEISSARTRDLAMFVLRLVETIASS